jgi:hypothetical protein
MIQKIKRLPFYGHPIMLAFGRGYTCFNNASITVKDGIDLRVYYQ